MDAMSEREYPWKVEVLGEYCFYYETREEAEEARTGIIKNLASCIASACPTTDMTFHQVFSKFEGDVTIRNLWEST